MMSDSPPLIAVRIKDGVFVGNVTAAHDEDFLYMNKVTHILNCAAGEVRDLFLGTGTEYLSFPWREAAAASGIASPAGIMFDSNDRNIEQAVRFIDRGIEHGQCVLVHSVDGTSRCCALVAAYLIAKYGWKVDNALSFMQMAHQEMDIRPPFMRQLKAFAKRHAVEFDVFDPDVDDSRFALDNDQWMLRNTLLNGLTACVQEGNVLHRQCTRDVGLLDPYYKSALQRRRRLTFVDTNQGTSVRGYATTPVVHARPTHHADPYAGGAHFSGASGAELIARARQQPPASVVARPAPQNDRRLESPMDVNPKGRQQLHLRPREDHSRNTGRSNAVASRPAAATSAAPSAASTPRPAALVADAAPSLVGHRVQGPEVSLRDLHNAQRPQQAQAQPQAQVQVQYAPQPAPAAAPRAAPAAAPPQEAYPQRAARDAPVEYTRAEIYRPSSAAPPASAARPSAVQASEDRPASGLYRGAAPTGTRPLTAHNLHASSSTSAAPPTGSSAVRSTTAAAPAAKARQPTAPIRSPYALSSNTARRGSPLPQQRTIQRPTSGTASGGSTVGTGGNSSSATSVARGANSSVSQPALHTTARASRTSSPVGQSPGAFVSRSSLSSRPQSPTVRTSTANTGSSGMGSGTAYGAPPASSSASAIRRNQSPRPQSTSVTGFGSGSTVQPTIRRASSPLTHSSRIGAGAPGSSMGSASQPHQTSSGGAGVGQRPASPLQRTNSPLRRSLADQYLTGSSAGIARGPTAASTGTASAGSTIQRRNSPTPQMRRY